MEESDVGDVFSLLPAALSAAGFLYQRSSADLVALPRFSSFWGREGFHPFLGLP